MQPPSWRKVLPPHFLAARQTALLRAQEFERHSVMAVHPGAHGVHPHDPTMAHNHMGAPPHLHNMAMPMHQQQLGPHYGEGPAYPQPATPLQPLPAFHYPGAHAVPPMAHPPSTSMYNNEDAPMDEAPVRPIETMDPPDDEPPSLSKRSNQDGSNSFSTGDPLATFSSEQQTTAKHVYSSDDNHGESYEDTEFLGSNGMPSNSDSRDYYGDEMRDGGYYHNPSESVLSPGEYSQHTGPNEPPYPFQEPAEPEQHQDHDHMMDLPKPIQKEEGYRYVQREEAHHHHASEFGTEGQDESYRFEHSHEVQEEEPSFDSYGEHGDENKRERSDLPPPSPSSQPGGDHASHTSSAMRGAQELLKRNRQKRLEMAARRSTGSGIEIVSPNNPLQVDTHRTDPIPQSDKDVISPQSATTWESSSEVTSVVSGTSSAWTDGSAGGDRSSRRALILQMAKARMKKNSVPKPGDREPVSESIHEEEEEKKLDSAGDGDIGFDVKMTRTNSLAESGTGTDIDISQDLD